MDPSVSDKARHSAGVSNKAKHREPRHAQQGKGKMNTSVPTKRHSQCQYVDKAEAEAQLVAACQKEESQGNTRSISL